MIAICIEPVEAPQPQLPIVAMPRLRTHEFGSPVWNVVQAGIIGVYISVCICGRMKMFGHAVSKLSDHEAILTQVQASTCSGTQMRMRTSMIRPALPWRHSELPPQIGEDGCGLSRS